MMVLSVAFLTAGCSNGDESEPESKIDRFKVATLNVDGLPLSVSLGKPEELGVFGGFLKILESMIDTSAVHIRIDGEGRYSVMLNPDGPGEEGSELIGEKIRERRWDVIGFNEDFNYHDEIWRSLDGYSAGTYMGKITGNLEELISRIISRKILFDIDGLEFGIRKPYAMNNEVIRPWVPEAVYGYMTNCQDSLTMKGFRYYQLCPDSQTSVDFILLHTDAGYEEEDARAREAAYNQLYKFITEEIITNNPLVIMGDFNSLYVRDRLKELFIDRLNATPNLEARDVWVEYLNGGEYPEYRHFLIDDDQFDITENSEMLDKIIYVNRRTAPIRLKLESAANALSFTYADGKPLSDHYPLEAEFVIER